MIVTKIKEDILNNNQDKDLTIRLSDAVVSGDIDKAGKLIAEGADVNGWCEYLDKNMLFSLFFSCINLKSVDC